MMREIPPPRVICPEDGGTRLLRNPGKFLADCLESRFRRQ